MHLELISVDVLQLGAVQGAGGERVEAMNFQNENANCNYDVSNFSI